MKEVSENEARAIILKHPKRESQPWDYPNQPFEIRLKSGALMVINGCVEGKVIDLRTGKEFSYTPLY